MFETAKSATPVLLLLVLAAAAVAPALAAEVDVAQGIESELHHAETYYWFGMAEMGNMAAYAKGLQHLARAETHLEEAALPEAERAVFRDRIAALRTDLEEQAEIGHDTLYGVFPLFRFFGPTVFADQTNLETFELLDDPAVMATTSAARKLALTTLQRWTPRAQLDVIFVSVPREPALENEALFVFNTEPKFFVHNLREAVAALTPTQRTTFLAGETNAAIQETLLRAFDTPELLIVLVRSVDVVDGDHFSVLEARLYRRAEAAPTHKLAVMGFSRDRRDQFLPILVATLMLLLFAYGAFASISTLRRRASVRISPLTYAVAPLLAFTAGRTAPWLIAPLLRRIAPGPENLAIVSFWAPLAAGLALLVLPIVAHWAFAARLARVFPSIAFNGRGASTAVAIGAGIVAYLAVPTFLYMPSDAVVVLLGLTVSVTILAALLGRALDSADSLSGGFVGLVCLLAMGVTATYLLGSPGLLWATTLLVIVLGGAPFIAVLRRPEEVASGPDDSKAAVPMESAEGQPTTRTELVERAEQPRFQGTPAYREALERLKHSTGGGATSLALVGDRGAGVSATLDALVAERMREAAEAERPVVLLRGEGVVSRGEAAPYEPFRRALSRHFQVQLLVESEAGAPQLSSTLGGLVEAVLPFGSILLPDTSGTGSGTSRDALFASVGWMLMRLAKTHSVILVLDDVQHFDEASTALLRHLHGALASSKAKAVTLLAGSHDQAALEAAGFDPTAELTRVPYPELESQVEILTHGIGLAPRTARQIVERVGSASRSTDGLTWLLHVVADIARSNSLVRTGEGFAWPEERWPADLPVPRGMGEALRERLHTVPEYRDTLQAAACACEGREFRAAVLAGLLGQPRLKLLRELDAIDRETGIVLDVGARDDVYAFASTLLLDVVRTELRVSEAGPEADDVPQIVREYHAHLAEHLEAELAAQPGLLYRVAGHYFAAGARHAGKGMQYNLLAARAHAAVADFDGASRSLDRAAACARVDGHPEAIDSQRLWLDCQRAHVAGDRDTRVSVARAGAAHLERDPRAPLSVLLAVAQAHYDAGHSTGASSYFEAAIRIGRDIVARAKTPLEEATGRHFVGISLPRAHNEDREAELRAALALVESAASPDPEGLRLHGRIMGSLAEELAHGTPDAQDEARQLFERRLTLITESGIGDPKGLAMTHGGLGRLAFFTSAPDLDRARAHFMQDLKLSEAIGDILGQVQMQSLLGAVALEAGDVESAETRYRSSWDLGTDPVSRTFSGAGLITVYGRTQDAERLETVARDLLDSLEAGPLSAEGRDALRRGLEACPAPERPPAADALLERVVRHA